MPESMYALRSAEYARYCERIGALLQPTDLLIDSQAPDFRALREAVTLR
jgi:hypothetical protein